MTDKAHYQTLFAYHWHTTRQLIDKAAKLETDDYQSSGGYGHGSIHDLFLHLLSTDQGWRAGLDGCQQPPALTSDDFPDLDAVRAAFEREREAWDAVLEDLTDADIAGPRDFTSAQGETYPIPCWRVLQHLVLHGMQHHAELAHLLTDKGHSPGNLDFIFYG